MASPGRSKPSGIANRSGLRLRPVPPDPPALQRRHPWTRVSAADILACCRDALSVSVAQAGCSNSALARYPPPTTHDVVAFDKQHNRAQLRREAGSRNVKPSPEIRADSSCNSPHSYGIRTYESQDTENLRFHSIHELVSSGIQPVCNVLLNKKPFNDVEQLIRRKAGWSHQPNVAMTCKRHWWIQAVIHRANRIVPQILVFRIGPDFLK